MLDSIAYPDLAPPRPTFVPPLDIAREQARRTLDEANALDAATTDQLNVAGSFGALRESLRQLLAALDAEDAKGTPTLEDGPRTLTVRICDRGAGRDYVGVTIRTVTIPANCPVCGGPRGVDADGNATVRNHNFSEDGDWYSVDRWSNPCGHSDMYADVLREARAYAGGGGRHA